MRKESVEVEGCFVLSPDVFEDERGYFFESFNQKRFEEETGINFNVKQINQSRSHKGVLRGMHFQKAEMAQAKLISCIEGELLDVAVDLRRGSPTFKRYSMVRLSADNKKQFYIPKGVAHGFLVTSDSAKLSYLVDEIYSKEHDAGVSFADPEVNIPWEYSEDLLILSEKDRNLPTISNCQDLF